MLNEKDQKKLHRVLNKFNGKTLGFKPSEYQSFSAMRQVRLKRTIKLMFGYSDSRNPIYSESVEFGSMDMFLEVQRLLDSNLSKEIIEDDLFKGLEEDNDD